MIDHRKIMLRKTGKYISILFFFLCLTLWSALPVYAGSSISFSPAASQLMMKAGSAKTLKVIRNHRTVASAKLLWKSSNTKTATVKNGKILARKSGIATISVSLKNDKKNKISCRVYVYSQDKKISFDKKDGQFVNKGSSFTLKPSKTCRFTVWKTSDPKIAVVSQKGKVKVLNTGNVTITCFGVNGGQYRYVGSVKLRAGILVQSVKTGVPEDTIFVCEGESCPGKFSVSPANATTPGLKYTSANTSIARVDADGTIYAVNPGSTTITAAATDGSGKKAVLHVIVRNSSSPEKVLLTAHKGASLAAPENTIPAFELAGAAGAKAIECDVYVTKDSQFVIHHDKSIVRMCGIDVKEGEDTSKYHVQNMTLEELQKYSIRTGSNVENYTDLKIPTLYEYLMVCNKYQATPVIELKGTYTAQNLEDLKRELSISSRVPMIISFNSKWLIPFSNRTGYRVQYIMRTYSSSALAMCRKYHWGLDLNYTGFTDDQIREYLKNGVEVQLWLMDDPAAMTRYIEMGVREFTTDSLFMTAGSV